MQRLDIVGLNLNEAATILNEADLSFRITRRDKTYYVVTRDHRPERVNLQLDEGKITSYNFG